MKVKDPTYNNNPEKTTKIMWLPMSNGAAERLKSQELFFTFLLFLLSQWSAALFISSALVTFK